MLDKGKVSIIVPCYNQVEYLKEAVESVLAQTYQNWECIIVNDGSKDSTERIGQELAGQDVRIIYLSKINGGLSDARNFGITNSSGEFILPLDCDDKIGSQYLELAVKKFDEDFNIQLIYCEAEFFDALNGKWKLPDYSYDLLLFQNMIFCSALYRRERYNKTEGYRNNMKFGSEDWDFWLSLLNVNDKVYKIPKTQFFYRQKTDSMLKDLKKNNQRMYLMQNQVYLNHKDIYDKVIFTKGGIISILFKQYKNEKSYLYKLNRRLNALFNKTL